MRFRAVTNFVALLAGASLFVSCSVVPGNVAPSPGLGGYPGWPPRTSADSFGLLPIPISSELAVGSNRFLLNLLDRDNQPVASPDRGVTLNFYDLAADPASAATSVAGTYMPTTAQLPGLYRAQVEFGSAGEWGLEVIMPEPGGGQRTGRMVFPVRQTTSTPAIGAEAPASETPTATTDEEIGRISTDRQPDPDFYRTSVDEALAQGRPFVLVFATPAFCRTATCGPTLDIVKSVAEEHQGETEFIHVEPYRLTDAGGQLQPELDQNGQLVPVEAVLEWGLPTEPYIFVVDAEGKVRTKLEGVAAAEEIRAALDEVAR